MYIKACPSINSILFNSACKNSMSSDIAAEPSFSPFPKPSLTSFNKPSTPKPACFDSIPLVRPSDKNNTPPLPPSSNATPLKSCIKSKSRGSERISFSDSLESICYFLKSQSPSTCNPEYDSSTSDVVDPSVKIKLVQVKRFSHSLLLVNDLPINLDRLYLDHSSNIINGEIKVKNFSFQKVVHVRFSFDNWMSFDEVQAFYHRSIPASPGSFASDIFTFSLSIPKFNNSQKISLDFCLRYTTPDQVYWDNNGGQNYIYHLTTSSAPTQSSQKSVQKPVQSLPLRPSSNNLWEMNKPKTLVFSQNSQYLANTKPITSFSSAYSSPVPYSTSIWADCDSDSFSFNSDFAFPKLSISPVASSSIKETQNISSDEPSFKWVNANIVAASQ